MIPGGHLLATFQIEAHMQAKEKAIIPDNCSTMPDLTRAQPFVTLINNQHLRNRMY